MANRFDEEDDLNIFSEIQCFLASLGIQNSEQSFSQSHTGLPRSIKPARRQNTLQLGVPSSCESVVDHQCKLR